MTEKESSQKDLEFYCPNCRELAEAPLVCGDCMALICRQCGTPLDRADELGMG